MKRSEINAAMIRAEALLEKSGIRLPHMAYWTLEEWRKNRERTGRIRRLELGWDITDFGSGNFAGTGAVLYTVRNGIQDDPEAGVPYCEKYIIMEEGQRLPKHYHVFKTEDIINRAGGVLLVRLWNADREGRQLDTDVKVYRDGLEDVVKAGTAIRIEPGNSISLTPYMAHVFGPEAGSGPVVVGEVSRVNDDHTDNFFLEKTARFAEIEEDVPVLRPLCTEYDRLRDEVWGT